MTVFLSNDATAVVLTPAVAAVVKAAKAEEPLPYLFICAFIANAASFVLPISNPANLVIYGSHMPPLLQWLPRYALPSALSILATYLALRWTQRERLRQNARPTSSCRRCPRGGKMAALGIAVTAIVLLASSALGLQLGLPTFLAGSRRRCWCWSLARAVSLTGAAGYLLGRAAAGRRAVRACGGAGEDRRDRTTRRAAAAASCEHSATRRGLGVGRRPRGWLQPVNNLPAGLMAGRVVELAQRAGTRARRRADRRGSGAEPVGHRVARDDPVADGAAARRPECERLDLPQARRAVMPPALLLAIAGVFAFG